MNTNKVNLQLKYQQYFDPQFNWDDISFYFNIEVFTEEFLKIFFDKINWSIFTYATYDYTIHNMNNKKLSNLYIKYIRKHLNKTNTI